jgi:hypothetical protein
MHIETITYKDLNGVERKENFYFDLTQSELVKMENSIQGGLKDKLVKITESIDPPAIMEMFEEIIKKSYGVKSEDGRRFIKKPELAEEFMQTPAYDIFFMQLLQDEKKAADFINNVIPQIEEPKALPKSVTKK